VLCVLCVRHTGGIIAGDDVFTKENVIGVDNASDLFGILSCSHRVDMQLKHLLSFFEELAEVRPLLLVRDVVKYSSVVPFFHKEDVV